MISSLCSSVNPSVQDIRLKLLSDLSPHHSPCFSIFAHVNDEIPPAGDHKWHPGCRPASCNKQNRQLGFNWRPCNLSHELTCRWGPPTACLELDVLAHLVCVGLKHLLQMGLVVSVGFSWLTEIIQYFALCGCFVNKLWTSARPLVLTPVPLILVPWKLHESKETTRPQGLDWWQSCTATRSLAHERSFKYCY